VDVQLHTHRHRTPRNRELFLREIKGNAARIRELRGADVPLEHFCYPSGEYFGEFFGWLRECGVHYATTCVPDLASRDTDRMLVPRLIDTMLQSDIFAALLPRRREYLLDTSRLAFDPTPSATVARSAS
jgi:hypothetical protein